MKYLLKSNVIYYFLLIIYNFPGLKTKDSNTVERKSTAEPLETYSKAATSIQTNSNSNVLQDVDIQRTKEGVDKYKASQEKKLGRKKAPSQPKSVFSLAQYRPNKNSAPIMAGVNRCLSNLNDEFNPKSSGKEKTPKRSKYYRTPKFDPSSANTMDIVGNIKVGQKVPVSSARHIMIVTTWRSGSTFLGDLLNHYKGVFYYFEPLHYFAKVKKTPQSEIEFLESLLKCRYDQDNIGYLHHISKPANKFLFKNHNFRLWNTCSHLLPQEMMCLLPEYLNKVCPLYPIKLIKTVRLDLRDTETLIKDPSLDLKILFLVRDPRGTYNSRSSTAISNWCNKDQCADPEVGCEQMMDNINAAFDLETRYPGTIKLVRYEDLSMYPHDVVADMMDFLDLPMIEELNNYIVTHTGAEKLKIVRNKKTHKVEHKKNPYGTSRNSTATAYAWRDKLSFDHIEQIQDACSAPMSKLGYRLLNNPEETKNKNLPLDSNLETIWPFE